MGKPKIKSTAQIVPMIYAYTTPEIRSHDRWTKIGYTEQDVDTRIRQQTHTANVKAHKEWQGTAIYDDGSGKTFKDTDFHAYLTANGIRRLYDDDGSSTEWFNVNGNVSRMMFFDFKSGKADRPSSVSVIPYTLRAEQTAAVSQTQAYINDHPNGESLWNAKPRFGKTLSVYDLCKQIKAEKVLIVTNRPAIANSWYDDYRKFLGKESGYLFVSENDNVKNEEDVFSRKEYTDLLLQGKDYKLIEFISLQDLKGSVYFGGHFDKLREIKETEWDILVIDEAHEGVDTYKTDIAFDHIRRKFTLHLSGTPFKALANDKFSEDAIYNWTYADEQRAKREWDYSKGENPYENLPRLNLFTYQMSEIIKDQLQQGIEIQGETEEYAFDLNEFFETNSSGKFVHEKAVDEFLDALTEQDKFPFSTPELRNELKHTFWLLNRVDSAKALAKKLKKHPVFKDYAIVLAAGDGKLSEDEESLKSFDKVIKAIKNNDKTITLSVGQLTTGITVPEWTAVLMLSNLKSPALYMQAAFRAQNPCVFAEGKNYYRKKNAYVFDFDPARTLTIFEEFANDLASDTSGGKGDMDMRKQHVRELLNFFPVYGEDTDGSMILLDAEKVLSIPRKIRSVEVVKRGFMSDFLFQNITNVFHAPPEVIEIIKKFEPTEEPKAPLTSDSGADIPLNDDGDVELPKDKVIGLSDELFGDKIYGDVEDQLEEEINTITSKKEDEPSERDKVLERMKEVFQKKITDPLVDKATEEYGQNLSASGKKTIDRKIRENTDRTVEKVFGNYNIEKNTLDLEFEKRKDEAPIDELPAIQQEYDDRHEALIDQLKEDLNSKVDEIVHQAGEDVVSTVVTEQKEKEKKSIETTIKDYLRGFSRTIPSFLMAYGNDKVTLENFDKIIPDSVFKEVTSITLDEFRFLRDGGPYIDDDTGEEKHFEGSLFDPIVFNDSVKEFLSLKKKLANYFDENTKEDIFDYIPPQKTNQIFTPKRVVKDMTDLLEKENPGCFDNPDKTFIDLYMKSGLYVAEIVKRLYRSEKMKQIYPNDEERLNHIFAEQVYGLAPTEIIYRIARSFVLGFSDKIEIRKDNLRLCDSLKYAQSDDSEALQKKLEELFDV